MPGRRAKHGAHHRDAAVGLRSGQLHAHTAKLLIEQALQLAAAIADHEGGMLVEPGKHPLHRRVEQALLVHRLEIGAFDRAEHLGKAATVASAVAGQPGHHRGGDHHEQHEEIAFGHGEGVSGGVSRRRRRADRPRTSALWLPQSRLAAKPSSPG